MSKPRPLTQRELLLMQRYSYCEFGMTPRQFHARGDVNYELSDRAVDNVAQCDRLNLVALLRKGDYRGRSLCCSYGVIELKIERHDK